MDFTDIDKNLPDGNNMGGLVQKIYFGYWDDVATWPTKPSLPLTPEDNGVLTGSLVMKTGKRLFELYITDDTGEFNIESVGEVDGKSFVEHLNFFHPGLQKKILGFINAAKNENLVFIPTDAEGQMYLMGDSLRSAIYNGAPDGSGTGKEAASRKGISCEFLYKTPAAYVYEGTVPLTPAASV